MATRYIDWSDVANKYMSAAKIAGAAESRGPFLESAEAEVEAWLSQRYTVPFSPAPAMVKDLCVDLAYYKMSIMQEGSDKLAQYVEKRLKMLVDGEISLPGVPETADSTDDRAFAAVWSLNARDGFIDDEPINPRYTGLQEDQR